MRPVIGITATYSEDKGASTCPMTYIESVIEAGGVPLLIPVMPEEPLEKAFSSVDGLVFTGGVDVDPRLYNERPSPRLGRINPVLDKMEIWLARRALDARKPLLGICRGCQIVTVAAGGTLIQDIPTQVGGAMKHEQDAPRWYGTHEAVLNEDSLAARVFGKRRLMVNSFHHQCIETPGEGFTVTGRALDGVTEAAEAAEGFSLLLQWHPEGMWSKDRTFLKPFVALCRVAAGEELLD